MRSSIRLAAVLCLLLLPQLARAGGPRFVTGPPFFTGQQGVPVGWKQSNLLYYTDPGALSTAVNHQAADALVAAAAGVWNLPVASITVAQGGALAEHVSEQNAYFDLTGLVFPADVMSTNAAAIPVAVIYDTDGSVTDLVLGSGASSPSACRQNAVTQTIDSFDPAGYILHAMIVLNGRCTGTAPELQLEMQYRLMRAFGRVLGLAWSQTNDNVFTGSPTPTYAQAMNWPIMHPLDIICGPYAYQCLPSPFQLRPDDISGMVAVYPIGQNAAPPSGKQPSLNQANNAVGHIYFPTGEGMAGVNVLVQREPARGTAFDSYYSASAVSGAAFRSAASSPFVTPDTSAWGSFGSSDPNQSGAYSIAYVPIYSGVAWQNLKITTEPVNALYSGEHGLSPYTMAAVALSGSPTSQANYGLSPWSEALVDLTVSDAAATCGNGSDGTASAPMPVPATGWWTGLLCGYGHASYIAATVKPNRSFTVEVTALDAQGLPTEAKAMPVIGLFSSADSADALPSLGVTPAAFDSTVVAMTSIGASTGQLTSFWFGIADQRGDGRPDYAYQARLFYADTMLPAQTGTAGGKVTIAGTGFRAGNAVTVNGVAVKVLSWTANAIVVTMPSMAAAHATAGTLVDVTVSDLSTGAVSTMSAAFTFTSASALPNTMRVVSAQTATIYAGDVATTPFAVQVLKSDGVTPVAGDSVVFSVAPGSAQLAACGAALCTVLTDAHGMASTGITALTAGTITMQAMDGALTQTASFTSLAQTGSLIIWSAPAGNVPVGVVAPNQIAVADFQPNNGGRNPGRAITFSVLVGAATFSGCNLSVCTVTASSSGDASIYITPTAVGPVTIQAADGDVTTTASFIAISNTDVMTIASAPDPSVYIGTNSGTFAVNLFQADGATRDVNQLVTFTGPAAVYFDPCASNVCTTTTGWGGVASVGIHVAQTGTFTVSATFGGATQSVTFSVVPHTTQVLILSAPSGTVSVGTVAAVPFSVQMLQDGVTPIPNATTVLSGPAGSVALTGCPAHLSACSFNSDSDGIVSTTLTPLVPGLIRLSASYAPGAASTTFTAVGPGESMNILQQPAANVFVGDTVNIAVQVLAPGGLSPLAGDNVEFSVVSGPFGFSDVATTTVVRQTDGTGILHEVGVASAPGTITVSASDGVASQTFVFTAAARLDVVQIVSAPASGGPAGAVAAIPFAVQVFAYDGVTPLASRSVTVSVTNGAASFAGYAGASTCQIVTDAQGMISTLVTPLSAGTITLTASEGGVQQSISFTAVPAVGPVLSLTAQNHATYVAAGARVPLALNVVALDNAAPASGQDVVWNLVAGITSATTVTVTNSVGATTETGWLGPLAGGTQAIATACAWTNICAQFAAFGVPASGEAIEVISGAQQSVSGGAALAPVVIMVVDSAGHPVVAAPVSVYQTVTAFDAACPARGRCPAAPVLASQATALVSGFDGTVTVTPMTGGAASTQTEIVFAAGTQGSATAIETVQP